MLRLRAESTTDAELGVKVLVVIAGWIVVDLASLLLSFLLLPTSLGPLKNVICNCTDRYHALAAGLHLRYI